MTSISFQNSDEFKSFTSRVCTHLSKTKLNQLRSAIAKELGHHHLSTYYAFLDKAPSGKSLDDYNEQAETGARCSYADFGFTEDQLRDIQNMSSLDNPGALIVSGTVASGKSLTSRKIFGSMIGLKTDTSGNHQPAIAIESERSTPIPDTKHLYPKFDPTGDSFRYAVDSAARMAPDFILADEMRFGSSAMKTISLAQAGIKVVSTTQASEPWDTPGALKKEGMADAFDHKLFSGFIHQALTPKLCNHCSSSINVKADGKDYEDSLITIIHATGMNKDYSKIRKRNHDGCEYCKNGWTTLTVIAEVIPVTESLMNILKDKGPSAAREKFIENGGMTIQAHAVDKVLTGEVDPIDAQKAVNMATGAA